MYKFNCYFKISLHPYQVCAVSDSFHKLKDGFWVDRTFNFTVGQEAVYWIPPSAIKYIEKVREETGGDDADGKG